MSGTTNPVSAPGSDPMEKHKGTVQPVLIDDSSDSEDDYEPSDHSDDEEYHPVPEPKSSSAPRSTANGTTSNARTSTGDLDLDGHMNKFALAKSVPLETVLVIKWRDWDGLSYQQVANKYKAIVLCKGKCSPTCSHTYSQQATTKRYKAGIDKFFAEFPEAANWAEIRADVKNLQRKKARQPNNPPTGCPSNDTGLANGTGPTNGAGPSNTAAQAFVAQPLTIEQTERLRFLRVADKFVNTLQMESVYEDEDSVRCLIPKEVLPHQSSTSATHFQEIEKKPKCFSHSVAANTPIESKVVYRVFKLPTTEATIHRYAQCVVMSRKDLPVYDFWLRPMMDNKTHDIKVDRYDHQQVKIEWTITETILLYVFSFSFGNVRVCDMVLNSWVETYHAEERARRQHSKDFHIVNKSTVQLSKTTCTQALELDPDAIFYLFKYTLPDHPGRNFWKDAMTAKGVNLYVSAEGDIEIKRDQSITQLQCTLAKYRLLNDGEAYHLHSRIGKVCYKKLSDDAAPSDPRPAVTRINRLKDMLDSKLERMSDRLEARLEEHGSLTKKEYDEFFAKVQAAKAKMQPKIRPVEIDHRRRFGPDEPTAIPEGFIVFEENAHMAG